MLHRPPILVQHGAPPVFPSDRRLDQILQHIELYLNQPVSDQELIVSRESLDFRQKPFDEVVGPRQHVLFGWHMPSPNIFGRASPCTQRIQFTEKKAKQKKGDSETLCPATTNPPAAVAVGGVPAAATRAGGAATIAA